MISVSLRYYCNLRELLLRECSVSDDGESKSSKMARLSFIMINQTGKDDDVSDIEGIIRARYPIHNLIDEYVPQGYAY